MVIEMKNISKRFGDNHVLKDISFSVDRGEVVSIIGPSGSGKSTLLRCCTFLETIDGGEILYLGQHAARTNETGGVVYVSAQELKHFRSYCGLVFQQFNLFPHYSVLKNLTDAPIHVQKRDKAEAEASAMELLGKMGIADKANAYPYQLSGGQQQRVSIARALVKNPSVILADEPTANLDSVNAVKIIELMQEMNVSHNTTFIFSTHDRMVMDHCRRLIKIKDGKVEG